MQKEGCDAFLLSLNSEILIGTSEVTKLEYLQALADKIKKLLPHAAANLHPGRAILFLRFVVMCRVSQTVSCPSTALQSFRVLSEAVQHIDGQSVRDLEKRVLDDPTDEAAQVTCIRC